MKRFLILSIVLFFTVGFTSAQIVDIFDENGNIITNTTIKFYNVPQTTDPIDVNFKLRNNSSNEISIKIARAIVGEAVIGSTSQICTPNTQSNNGVCYMPSKDITNPFTLKANETSGEGGHISFKQGPNSGETTIEFTVMDVNDTFSSSFILMFSTFPPTAVYTNLAREFSVYPNPASNSFKIKHNFGNDAVVEVYNMLGKLVFKENSNSGVIDCSRWENGYYFCRLYNQGKIEKTIKIVVAH